MTLEKFKHAYMKQSFNPISFLSECWLIMMTFQGGPNALALTSKYSDEGLVRLLATTHWARHPHQSQIERFCKTRVRACVYA